MSPGAMAKMHGTNCLDAANSAACATPIAVSRPDFPRKAAARHGTALAIPTSAAKHFTDILA